MPDERLQARATAKADRRSTWTAGRWASGRWRTARAQGLSEAQRLEAILLPGELRLQDPEVVSNLCGLRGAILEALGAAPHPR
ncbi:MAG: hypothetical protein VKS61_00695 [Candidatus Sericytochromatia bacterium]|nr:hypothetical protein [Candidatus Sericytochromatia bacterium]